MSGPQNNNTDMWSKILLLESKINETERGLNKLDSSLTEIHRKIDQIKDDLRNHKNIPQIESKIKEVEEEVDSVKLELPEIRLIKKMFMGLVAFLLSAFLGLIWNALIINPNKISSTKSAEEMDAIAKRFVEEYKKKNIQ
jgi:uncharacterized coiled-coil protein SlyX